MRNRVYKPSNPQARDHYCVDIPAQHRRRDYTSVKKCVASTVPWAAPVYCLSVSSSYIVVRRNGKVAVTGNSKRRENDYKRILQDRYQYKIRSFLTSNMDATRGPVTVLVEATIKVPNCSAWLRRRDYAMIDHCLRSALPEDHPNHYDIHSNVAVRAFHLDCEPTKRGLESINRTDLRVGANNVIFGGGYGRSAEAISRQAQEEGVTMSEAEAENNYERYF